MRDAVVVCGSRSWTDEEIIRERIFALHPSVKVIHGGARGPDRTAGRIAKEQGHTVIEVRADWLRYGKAAGYKRNEAMLSLEPMLVIAFYDGSSRGTAHMIRIAEAAGIPVEVIQTTPEYEATHFYPRGSP